MRVSTTFGLLLLGAMAVSSAGAAESAARPPLRADDFGALLGRWTGVGTFARTGAKVESDLEFATTAGGEAIELHQRERMPNKFAYEGLWSMDTLNGGLVMMLAGNLSGGARLFRSEGWRRGCLDFRSSSTLQAWFAAERFEFCLEQKDRMKVTYALSRDAGTTWITGDTQVYSKVAPENPAVGAPH